MKKILLPGIAFALFMLMLDTLRFTHHLPENTTIAFLLQIAGGFVPIFLIMIWVKRKYYTNNITFKEAFSSVAFIAAFACVLAGVIAFIILKFNQAELTDFVAKEIPKAKQRLLDTTGSVPLGFEDRMKHMIRPEVQAMFYLVWMVILLLFTLISATILKNNKQDTTVD